MAKYLWIITYWALDGGNLKAKAIPTDNPSDEIDLPSHLIQSIDCKLINEESKELV